MTRRAATRILVVLGTLLAILAILAVWVSRQALDTDEWTATSSKLLDDPAIQTAVAGLLVDRLYANVDVAAELQDALPPRADPLAAPAAGALRDAAETAALEALDRPAVQQAWEQANRQAHRAFVRVVEGGGNVVSSEGGVVTLDLKALLDEVAQRTGIGARAAGKLPADAATIEILRSKQLEAIQTIGRILRPLAAVFVGLMLACYAVAIAVARGRRRTTLRAVGIGLLIAGVTTLVIRRLGGDLVVGSLTSTAGQEPTVEAVWRIGTSLLADIAVAAIVYGALVIAGAWVAGPTRWAVGVRRWLAPYLRDARTTYAAVAVIVLLVLLWGPTEGTERIVPTLILLALFVAGVEALRRQARVEFPNAVRGAGGWSAARAPETVRPRPPDGGERPAGEVSEPSPPATETLATELERLERLHEAGVLDDDEFAAAKQRVLSGG